MSNHVILIEDARDRHERLEGYPLVEAREYLSDPSWSGRRGLRVINLCRSYRYQSIGYYCSLLGEARGHRVLPTIRTIQDLSQKSIYRVETADIDGRAERALSRCPPAHEDGPVELTIPFGESPVEELRSVARWLFERFPAPILRVELRRQGRWRVSKLSAPSWHSLDAEQVDQLFAAMDRHLARRWRSPPGRTSYRYDLAILHDPEEEMPPSNRRALDSFVRAARSLRIHAELVRRADIGRLAEYDALFIRETTRLDDHTYRFAKRAQSEDMVVIDDPESILRCTNKIFLAELLASRKIPTPRSMILRSDTVEEVEQVIPYPIVLKIPDGSFSRGIHKVEDRGSLEAVARRLFEHSDLILAQQFTYTEFDWRIGILDQRPLFACRYYMSRGHWQVVDRTGRGKPREGRWDTLPVEEAPARVVDLALEAARPIGDGLYGVDLKETRDGVLVIEVNDNPNLDHGVEDAVLKDELYRIVMQDFLRRLDARRGR